MWATLGSHAPTLTAVVMIGGLLVRYFPNAVAIFTKDDARRRTALEIIRLRRRDAAKIPSYLLPGEPPAPQRKNKALSKQDAAK